MKVVIVGAGRVGAQLVRELSSHGHDLVIIERDKAKAETASELYDASVIHGDAEEISVLRKAIGSDGADVLIAVSESDELNLVISLLASKLGVGSRVARIRNEEWFSEGGLSMKDLGLDKVIHPERETVEHLVNVIGISGAFEYSELADGEVVLIGFYVTEGLSILGHPLAELREQFALDSFLIIGLYRDNVFSVPHGSDAVKEGDKVWILVAKETLPFLMPVFKCGLTSEDRVVILGATRIGITLAEKFSERFGEVILVENDETKARSAAEKLEGVNVLRGGDDEIGLLREIGVGTINCFVAVSSDERVNLMSGLLAKRMGIARVAVVTNEFEFLPVMDAIGLDVVVNPLILTAGAILSHIRKGIVHSVVKLHAGEAEIIEYDITDGASCAGKTLVDAKFPRGSIVGTLLRGDTTIIPDGSTILEVGDRVVVVATSEKIPDIEKLFVARRSFF